MRALSDDDTGECGRIQNRFITEIMIFWGVQPIIRLIIAIQNKTSLHGASNR